MTSSLRRRCFRPSLSLLEDLQTQLLNLSPFTGIPTRCLQKPCPRFRVSDLDGFLRGFNAHSALLVHGYRLPLLQVRAFRNENSRETGTAGLKRQVVEWLWNLS